MATGFDPRKVQIRSFPTRELYYKVDQEAENRGMTMQSYIKMLYEDATKYTMLTDENLAKLKDETAKALEKRGVTMEILEFADRRPAKCSYTNIRKAMEGKIKYSRSKGELSKPRVIK